MGREVLRQAQDRKGRKKEGRHNLIGVVDDLVLDERLDSFR